MIKIKKEDFKKLKQLDRIEYRQRLDYIKEKYFVGRLFKMINFSALVMAIVLLLMFSGGAWLGDEFGLMLLETLAPIAVVCMVLVYIGGAWDLINISFKRKYIKELNEEYFKIELKIPKLKNKYSMSKHNK